MKLNTITCRVTENQKEEIWRLSAKASKAWEMGKKQQNKRLLEVEWELSKQCLGRKNISRQRMIDPLLSGKMMMIDLTTS